MKYTLSVLCGLCMITSLAYGKVAKLPGETWTLDNGMRVVFMEKHDTPAVALRVYVLVGSIDEEEWLGCGMSHYTEHLVSGGTTSTRTEQEGNVLLKKIGDRVNAYTTLDETCYHIRTTREHWETAAELLADWVKNCSLLPEEVEREKGVITQEIRMGREEPGRVMWKAFQENVYKEHPLRLPVIGYENLFTNVTRNDLVRFRERNYTADKMILAVVGDITREELDAVIEKNYADIPRGRMRQRVFADEPFPLSQRSLTKYANVTRAHVNLSFPTVEFGDDDMYALDLLTDVLTRGRSAPLTKKIKEEMQLVHSIDASHWTPEYAHGHFSIEFTCDQENVEKATEEIITSLLDIADNPPSKKEIERAKRQSRMSEINGMQTAANIAAKLANDVKATGEIGFHAEYLEKINSVEQDDIRQVAETYFNTNVLLTTSLLPATEEAAKKDTAKENEKAGLKEIQVYTLDNGITCVLLPDNSLPLVHVSMYVPGGMSTETKENNGVADLTARMMTRGTEKLTAQEIAAELDARGASLSYSANRDSFTGGAHGMAEDADFLLDICADTLMNSTFPEDEFVIAQKQAIAGIKARKENWFREAYDNFMAAIFPDHPYGMPVAGTTQTVQKLTTQDVIAHHARLLQPTQCVIAVGGDFSPEEMREKINNAFGSLQAKAAPFPPVPKATPVLDDAVTLVPSEREQATVIIGFPGPLFGTEESVVFDVMDGYLSGFGGPVFRSLRGDADLAYIAFCRPLSYMQAGLFLAAGQCTPENVPIVIEKLTEAVRTGASSLTDAECDRAKSAISVPYALSQQSLSARVGSAAQWEFFGKGAAYSTQHIHLVNAVTPQSVADAAATLTKRHSVVTAPRSVETMVKAFLTCYPEALPQDVYKVVLHGSEGPGHFGSDMQKIRENIEKEWNEIDAADEPLWFPAGINGDWGWLNLKAWKYQGGDVQTVIDAFTASIQKSHRNAAAVSQNWLRVVAAVDSSGLTLPERATKKFSKKMFKENFPVQHHTKEFVEKYTPAYRVISRSEWEKALGTKK